MSEPAATPVTLMSPGHWRVGKSRVSLDSVVIAYWNGESTRTIVENYRSLNAEQVDAAITWYLANRAIVDEGMKQTEKKWEELRQQSLKDNSELHRRMRERMKTILNAAFSTDEPQILTLSSSSPTPPVHP